MASGPERGRPAMRRVSLVAGSRSRSGVHGEPLTRAPPPEGGRITESPEASGGLNRNRLRLQRVGQVWTKTVPARRCCWLLRSARLGRERSVDCSPTAVAASTGVNVISTFLMSGDPMVSGDALCGAEWTARKDRHSYRRPAVG